MGTIDTVHADMDIDLRKAEGKMIWQVLVMVSGMERDLIVYRHQAGRVNAWKRNAWFPSTAVPPGYVIGEGRKITILDDQIDVTRKMLTILANPKLTPTQVCRRLGDLGISTPKLRQLHGADATYADAHNTGTAVQSLLGWLPAYEHGVYEAVWPNQMPGITEFGGVDVETLEGYENGVLRLKYEVPSPDGGWAPSEVFDAIKDRWITEESTSPVRGGGAQQLVRPLTGVFRSAVDGKEHRLRAASGRYAIEQRTYRPDAEFVDWIKGRRGDHIATVDEGAMHRSIAHGVAEAIRDGVSARLIPGEILWIGPSPGMPSLSNGPARRKRLETHVEDETRRATQARHNANDTQDPDLRADFLEDAKRATAKCRRLKKLIEEIDVEAATPVLLPERFESNTDALVQALSSLANAVGPQPADMRAALQSIITDESLNITDDAVEWSLYVRIPVDQGVVVLGPITGTIPNLKMRPPTGVTRRQRKEFVNQLIPDGLSRLAAESAATCAFPNLVDALLSDVGSGPDQWIRHVRAVYLNPEFKWNRGRWMLDNQTRQKLCDVLVRHGGSASVSEVQSAGISDSQWRHLTRTTDDPSGAPIAFMGSGRGSSRLIELLRCPHCQGYASVSMPVPEVPFGVLCPECRRAPVESSPEFPAWYFEPVSLTEAA